MADSTGMRQQRRRRMMSEINVVPYIDVMLVLLIIFMVTAPMIVTGTIELPKVNQASPAAVAGVSVTIRQDGSLTVRKIAEGEREQSVSRDNLAATVRQMVSALDTPVVISAEKSVRYEHVIGAMNALQKAGYRRVGLDVGLE
jgi:biopolymer transport protein TolR